MRAPSVLTYDGPGSEDGYAAVKEAFDSSARAFVNALLYRAIRSLSIAYKFKMKISPANVIDQLIEDAQSDIR
ncbi:hypothetical protein FOMPIDRAFT_95161 [Fomitopsis schrenkii]|uniref:Uncharacterized protein n=1 Tax=Fomitopsis schrenkii TaxID=2126942 RepID=S8DFT1_FOMSC|nr:hypothetical protein FOMPIDRAFT_95161 [Fomitopsis schrenkii]